MNESEPYRNEIGDIEESMEGISNELQRRDEGAERWQGGVAVDKRRSDNESAIGEYIKEHQSRSIEKNGEIASGVGLNRRNYRFGSALHLRRRILNMHVIYYIHTQ